MINVSLNHHITQETLFFGGFQGKMMVAFEVMTHAETFTMQEVAAALHVPGSQVTKVVMVWADGKMAMLVVSFPDHLDFTKVRTLLGINNVRLAKEEEFGDLFPDCATSNGSGGYL